MRVVIAEDHALLREGLVALLREHDIEVVAQAEDAEGLLRIVGGHKPDLAIVDVRLPPTFTDEGIRAAIEARRRQPGLGVLVLSQYVEPVYTAELLEAGEGGVGYLLKERVGDVRAFLDASSASPTAAPRSTARSSPSSSGPASPRARRRPGRRSPRASARSSADGRGPHERRHRRARSSSPPARSRSTSPHLRQARPPGGRGGPPPGAGGAHLPALSEAKPKSGSDPLAKPET